MSEVDLLDVALDADELETVCHPTQKVNGSTCPKSRSKSGLFVSTFVSAPIFRRWVPLGTPTAEGQAD